MLGTGRRTLTSSTAGFSRYQSAWSISVLTALSECLEPPTASRIFIEDFLEVGDPRDPTVHILSPLANIALTEHHVFDLGQSMQTAHPEVAAALETVKGYRVHERRVA